MDAQRTAIAEACLNGAYDDSMSFPEGVRRLTEAGFDGYLVDYRRNTRTYYLPDGESLVLANPHQEGAIAAAFDKDGVAAAIKWAQASPKDYSYAAFNREVTGCGCAFYLVSLSGRRVVYFGRTGELHIERFPQ